MRRFILLFLIIIGLSSNAMAYKTACLTGTDATLQSMLEAFNLVVTTSCTTGFSSYHIVIDNGATAGVRAAATPTVIVYREPHSEWKFTDFLDTFSLTSTTVGTNPGTIDDDVSSPATIYTSSDSTGFSDKDGTDASTPLLNNDAWRRNTDASEIFSWWWDTSDIDNSDVTNYEQKGVWIGFDVTSKWTDSAKRIFNNSVNHACPYCFDDCSWPTAGNWGINKTCDLSNQDINITGDVSIFDTGSLNLVGSGGYLNFIGANRFIYIYQGGNLTLDTSATIGKWPPS